MQMWREMSSLLVNTLEYCVETILNMSVTWLLQWYPALYTAGGSFIQAVIVFGMSGGLTKQWEDMPHLLLMSGHTGVEVTYRVIEWTPEIVKVWQILPSRRLPCCIPRHSGVWAPSTV